MQRVARRLGHPIGMKRALRIIRELIDDGVLIRAGSYAKRRFGLLTGWKVALYTSGLRQRTSSVGRPKSQAAVMHPLFGGGDWSSYSERIRKWEEPPDWKVPWLHGNRC